MEDLIMYIVVNSDLNMSTGKIASQVAHACAECLIQTMRAQKSEQNKMLAWHRTGQRKIILTAPQSVMESLAKDKRFYPVNDNGCTEVEEGSLTAVCLGIHPRKDMAPITKKMQIL